MYETFFSLSKRPFSVCPDPACFYPMHGHAQIITDLADCVDHIDGIGLLVGESGLGKTLLCELLIRKLQHSLHGILVAHTNLASKRALLQAILFQLRQPYLGIDEQELRLALMNFLMARPASHASMLLVVDEAHGLGEELLEELRMLTNWTLGNRPMIRLVLAGQPLVEENLASEKGELLNQRVSRRLYLSPLTQDETAQYIDHRLGWAGAESQRVFTAEALEAIYRATEGVPRTINLLCDQTLLLAAQHHICPVPVAVVREAWGELQQMPSCWDTADESDAADRRNVVEFGHGALAFERDERSAPTMQQAAPDSPFAAQSHWADDDALQPGETTVPMLADSDVIPLCPDTVPGLCGIRPPAPEAGERRGTAAPNTAVQASDQQLDWHGMDVLLGAIGDEQTEGALMPWQDFQWDERSNDPENADHPSPLEPRSDVEPTALPAAEQSPLEERFDEEEAVLDQYAALDAEIAHLAFHAAQPLLSNDPPGGSRQTTPAECHLQLAPSDPAVPKAAANYRQLFSTLPE